MPPHLLTPSSILLHTTSTCSQNQVIFGQAGLVLFMIMIRTKPNTPSRPCTPASDHADSFPHLALPVTSLLDLDVIASAPGFPYTGKHFGLNTSPCLLPAHRRHLRVNQYRYPGMFLSQTPPIALSLPPSCYEPTHYFHSDFKFPADRLTFRPAVTEVVHT